jgi:hypothetical protein
VRLVEIFDPLYDHDKGAVYIGCGKNLKLSRLKVCRHWIIDKSPDAISKRSGALPQGADPQSTAITERCLVSLKKNSRCYDQAQGAVGGAQAGLEVG